MRILIIILCFAALPAYGQVSGPVSKDQEPIEDTIDDEPGYALTNYAFYFSTAFTFYEQKQYGKAEKYFRKAYSKFKNNEVAEYIYSCMLAEGYDAEAAVFRQKHGDLIRMWPNNKKSLESIYLDLGPRVSVNSSAGNIDYANAGFVYSLSNRVKYWQTFTYIRQDNNLGNYNQEGLHSSFSIQLNNGWNIQPSFNYYYTSYYSVYTAGSSFESFSNFVDPYETIFYKTTANQTDYYAFPGHSNYLNLSLSFSKRAGPFTFEVEPSLHYSVDKSKPLYTYSSNGSTDSFVNSVYKGSEPYIDSGLGTTDTTIRSYVGQLGFCVSYIWPVLNDAISTKFALYYLLGSGDQDAVALHFYALLKVKQNIWIHLDWIKKGDLPMMLNSGDLYFNFADEINNRSTITLQLWPLKKWSPAFTYQYEQDTRLQDNATLKYNSFYIALKYKL